MTRDEWDELTVAMLAYWPNKHVPGEAFDLWYQDLAEFPADQVGAAIRALGRDGKEWVPTGGQIRQKLLSLRTSTLDHSEAYELATRAAGEGGGFHSGLEWLEERSPLAAAAVKRFGWREWCYTPHDPGTRRAQFRDLFTSLAGQLADEEKYRGISAPGLEALESAGLPKLKKLSAGPERPE